MDLGMTSDTGTTPVDCHYHLDLASIKISDFDSEREADREDSDIVEVS